MFIIFVDDNYTPRYNWCLSVHFSEHHVQGSDDGHNVRQHVVLANMVGEGEVEEAGRLDLAPVWSGGSVRHQVHSELSLGRLDGSVGGAGGDREALGEELEVVDERLHGGLHLGPAGGNTLGVVRPHVACRHLVEALLHDPQTLPHLRHALQVSVVAVSVAAHRNVEIHQIIGVIGLGLPQIVLDTGASEHDTAAAPVDSILGGDDSYVNGSLLPQPVVGDHVLHLVQPLAELGDELVDVVQQSDGDVLVHAARPHVCSVHSGSTGSLVELHDLLPLLEEPEEGRDAANVEDVGADTHDVVQDAGQLSEQHPDVLGPQRDVDIEELLHGEAVGLLVAHHAYVVQTVEIRKSLHVGLILDQLLCSSVQ